MSDLSMYCAVKEYSNIRSKKKIVRANNINRRDPDYVPPKFTDEEMADMYAEHVEEERKERTIQEREIISTEEIF